jgi:DNA-binding HxlR family transcriptional regulator
MIDAIDAADMAGPLREVLQIFRDGKLQSDSPLREVLEQIGTKWCLLLLTTLHERPRRFGELRKALPDISQRMLTQTLRDLQRNGFISRHVHPHVPPSVEYRLTGLGRSLLLPLSQLVAWVRTHESAIRASRSAFESTAGSGT